MLPSKLDKSIPVLHANITSDNSGGFNLDSLPHPGKVRHVHLYISSRQDHYRLLLTSNQPEFDGKQQWFGDINISREHLWSEVEACRNVWRKVAIELKRNGRYLLQDEWNMTQYPGILDEILADLADVGYRLFCKIFRPNKSGTGDWRAS